MGKQRTWWNKYWGNWQSYQTTITAHNWVKKNKAIPQRKYNTLSYPEETVEMTNIRNEIHQLNQQIEVMGCNRWQFQELHRKVAGGVCFTLLELDVLLSWILFEIVQLSAVVILFSWLFNVKFIWSFNLRCYKKYPELNCI